MYPKISIVVPCYNVEKYIDQCLSSLLNQTLKEIEIIVINDGSTDNTLQILEKYAASDNRIRIVNQKNHGLSEARNVGMQDCTADYVMFVDGDDWIDPVCCEQALLAMEREGADLVMWSYMREFDSYSLRKKIFDYDDYKIFNEKECAELQRRMAGLYKDELSNIENADSLVTAWGKLYKKEFIRDTLFVDTKLIGTEDALFNLNVLFKVKKAVYLSEFLSHYRKTSTSSLTKSYKKDLSKQWSVLFSLMKKCLDDKNCDSSFYIALKNRIALSIIGLGLNESANPAGHLVRIKSLSAILSQPEYRDAYNCLEFKYLKLHWAFFFHLAKWRCSLGVYCLILIIRKIISR